MEVNEQLFEMMNKRFDSVDEALRDAKDAFAKHSEDDQKYWRILDEQQVQIGVIKRVFWGIISILGVIGTWLGLKH